jgi:HEAT repeat protein
MEFASSLVNQLGPAAVIVLRAIFFSLLGIFLLIAYIVIRRWYRGRYFRMLDEHTFAILAVWHDLVAGRLPAREWCMKPLDREIVETLLLDDIEMANSDQLPPLLNCLRSSGLLSFRIREARTASGWQRRRALLALGRSRAREAVPALAEALVAASEETRVAAVRGLGRTGLSEAAVPLLEGLLCGTLRAPEHTVKNALERCCRTSPGVLMPYLNQASGRNRELIARVLAEVASPELEDELLVLAADPLAEVRASAARALGIASPAFALPVLSSLASDTEWFVRLRAVVALGSLPHQGRLRPLIRALCDPNRQVRQRSAWALTRLGPQLASALEQVVETEDSYALQAFISELERSGMMERLIEVLQGQATDSAVESSLIEALARGRKQVEVAMTAAVGSGAR